MAFADLAEAQRFVPVSTSPPRRCCHLHALFILQFDSKLTPGARWLVLSVEKTNLATSFQQPDHDVEIE